MVNRSLWHFCFTFDLLNKNNRLYVMLSQADSSKPILFIYMCGCKLGYIITLGSLQYI